MNSLENTTTHEESASFPYLLFVIGKNIYGMNSEYVRGIDTLVDYTHVVDFEPNIRGVVFVQGAFIPLVDLRKTFGLPSQLDEFEQLVRPEQRIKEHEDWVAELERSVRERIPFSLTDDPRRCAFGQWYYGYRTDNHMLKHQLGAIEAPHAAIHNTAKTVRKLMNKNRFDEAMTVIQEMRESHYYKTIRILSSLRSIAESHFKDLYIVVDTEEGQKGLIVDAIAGVENLSPPVAVPDSIGEMRFIETLRQREKDGSVVFVLKNNL